LSKYDLYKSIGDGTNDEEKQSILWILNLSDGQNSLSDISEKSNIKFEIIKTAANRLLEKNLIKQI
jgi:aminopeptidase-like protein